MKNLLLIRLGGLGDLLVAFPSISLLRKALSPCMISLVCRKEYGMLLEETGVVDELISEDDRRLTPFFSDTMSLEEETKHLLNVFDAIIGWIHKKRALRIDKSWLAGRGENFRLFAYQKQSGEQISRFLFRKTKEFLEEKRERSLEFSECILLPLSLTQKKEGLELLGSWNFRGRNKIKEKIIVIHPGSGSRSKCWPLKNYLSVIRRLNQEGLIGVFVTGMAEEWMEEEIEESEWPENWVWIKSPSLLSLAGLLSQASFYLGNDSGITHLAAACGTKGLALFRKDLVPFWKPYGQVTVLSGESLDEIGVKQVCETFKNNLINKEDVLLRSQVYLSYKKKNL
jgi:heptosyltransferase-3